MQLLTRFLGFIEERCLITSSERCLLALSGGIDSMVLAHLMLESRLPFGIAHCNFQLRGAESDGDAAFVRDWAARNDVLYLEQSFDTESFAQENKLSIQMAARELRYRWFEEMRVENNFQHIVTAHHLNDSIETVLLNFVRGTGIDGLTGMAAQNGFIIRPLLFAARTEIEQYAAAKEITWREDRSNASDDYARNFVRHHIVPQYEQLNPEFLPVAARNMQRLQEQADNLAFFTEFYIGDDPNRISKERVKKLPAPARFLHDWLKQYGFTPEQARQIALNIGTVGMEWSTESGHRLLSDREMLLLSMPDSGAQEVIRVMDDNLMVTLPDRKRLFFTYTADNQDFPNGKDAVLVDVSKLKFPLTLRHWQPGDQFQPFGMGGKSQKLQDFFTNLKISRFDKAQIWVLENSDGALIWVLGYRPDERFKITPNTVKSLKINLIDLT